MSYVREVVEGKELSKIIDLPVSMKNKKVEIIVINYKEKANKTKIKSAAGILAKYANPTLREKEKDAWKNSVKKHF